MKFSYSRVDCFKSCPYKYKLRYIDKVEMLDDFEATDPLKLGTAVHEGIELDTKTAIDNYYMSYPVINDLHINEMIKLESVVKKAKNILPLENAQFEVKLECDKFVGYIDMLVKNDDGTYDIYDFKYSNNIDKYMKSSQLSIYAYYASKILNIKINKLYFVFIPKTMIRQKKTEDLSQFRMRLKSTIEDLEVQIKEVVYNLHDVIDFINNEVDILDCKNYIKNPTKLCDWCEYKDYCESGEDLNMVLPSTKRVEITKNNYKKIWIYGAPFCGKTTFADKAPTPLNLNTDGNCKYVTMPRISIKDEVSVEGRLTKRTFAWEIFKNAIGELEKGSDFETIVVDLLEDTYEQCRLYMYDKLNITHESDDSYRAWDKIRIEFLTTIKKLLNLDYNIILISHEDASKDLTKKSGDKITSISPNINEKTSKKIAGMVDLVARVVADEDKRTLSLKNDEVVFGGGRLQGIKTKEIDLNWDSLCKLYDEAIDKLETPNIEEETQNMEQTENVEQNDEPVEKTTRVRRTRKVRED